MRMYRIELWLKDEFRWSPYIVLEGISSEEHAKSAFENQKVLLKGEKLRLAKIGARGTTYEF